MAFPFALLLYSDDAHSAIDSLNSQSGVTAIAQLNLSRSVFEKTFSMGTSFLLHHATEIRGSM